MSPSEPSTRGPVDPAEVLGAVVGGRFSLTSLVSTGANAAVFDADDSTTGRIVTVKLVVTAAELNDVARERFDDTMRGVAALSHPNIAALYDWGITDVAGIDQPYVVVEQLTGGSLRDMFDRSRQLSPSQALGVGLDACRALDYAHRRGFVHSELTPSKLVFGDDRRLRITDFGLAGLLNEASWREPESVATHTAWYASPEQGRSEPIDGKTDVYALCLTLHEAVTGSLPFKHDSTVASLSARMGRLMPVSADLGPLAAVLEHAGRPEAAERASAAEFGRELVRAASKLPRPEPLPLLSTGLFETPSDRIRTPDDPTGGVERPASTAVAAGVAAGAMAASSATPSGDDLVILPLDSDIDGGPTAMAAADAPISGSASDAAVAGPAPDAAAAPDAAVAAAAAPAAARPTMEMPATEQHPVPAKRRGVPWKTLLAVLVAAALVVLGVLAFQLFTATPTYEVPDLVEMPEAEALNLVAANGWLVTVDRERSDLVPEIGLVVRTTPQAGVELAEGEPFLIVVSEGPTLRELPDSTGLTLADAQTRLVERGLEVLPPVEEFDEIVPEDVVIRWMVPGDPTLTAGSLVEPGTPVQLVVSAGPEPRVVPNVVGVPFGQASEQFDELGLSITETGQDFSDDIALGSIIVQSIEPGTSVPRGTDMTVLVSRGPDIVAFPEIPDGSTYEEAEIILIDAGFVPNLTFGDAQGEVQSMLIEGEEPIVGETYRRGTRVDIRAL